MSVSSPLVGGEYPILGLDRGVPIKGLGGGYPIQGLGGGYPVPGLGVPHPRSGLGVPQCTPYHDWMGYPPHPHHDWMGYPSPTPIRQSSIASTCYTAGDMPLAFTQEDFLVCKYYCPR